MRPSRKSLIAAAGAALVLAVITAGLLVGGDDPRLSTGAQAGASSTTTGDAPSGQLTGPRLPALKVESSTGEIELGALRGPTVIHVFASWCEVCRAEAEGFSKALKSAPDVRPIYLAVQDEPAASKAFMSEFAWPEGALVDDPDREIASRLGLSGQPHTILIDRDGATQTILGGSDPRRLAALLSAISA